MGKLVLVGIGVKRLGLLREVARVLIMAGAVSAVVNLLLMLWGVIQKSRARAPAARACRRGRMTGVCSTDIA
jgi:multisubunit Na+/H+ antiporter MnhC subunit